MRQGQQNRRGRNRGRKQQNPLARNYESNGPDVKIRGTASHIADKYGSLARDALSSGDPIAAENLFQHAEHYNRIIMAAQAQANPTASQPVIPENLNGASPPARISNGAEDAEDLAASEESTPPAAENASGPSPENGRRRNARRKPSSNGHAKPKDQPDGQNAAAEKSGNGDGREKKADRKSPDANNRQSADPGDSEIQNDDLKSQGRTA